jgi:hypothetical protein
MGYPTRATDTYRGRDAIGLSDKQLLRQAGERSLTTWERRLLSKTMINKVQESAARDAARAAARASGVASDMASILERAGLSRPSYAWQRAGSSVMSRAYEMIPTAEAILARTARFSLRGPSSVWELFVRTAIDRLVDVEMNGGNWFPWGSIQKTVEFPTNTPGGEYIVYCPDAPNGGPFPQTGLCGVVGSFHKGLEGVLYSENFPGLKDITWLLCHWFDATGDLAPGVPSVVANYYNVPEDDVDRYTPVWSGGVQKWTNQDPEPRLPPMLDPMQLPILPLEIAPTPDPVPYRTIPHQSFNPYRSPDHQHETDTSHGGRARPPRKTWEGIGEDLRERSSSRPRRRPGKNEKERKLNVLQKALVDFLMGVTEVNDFVDAMWHALPKSMRSPHKSGVSRTLEQYKDLYRNWQHIDLEKGLENFLINEIEDFVIGRAEGLIDKAKMRANQGRSGGASNVWQHKSLSPDFEGDLAQWLHKHVEDYVRGAVNL